ncbi:FAD-binding and (Fe-S)-binding domain-containing protein [Flavihumibacter stibioxidans]|uniref:D-lactate dehydrogenase (cytochrome) n=1 Tax=Flavihumibacter stibioxidans TaxID=1834163 RepID=A0ABR7MAM4_9BACT|nr:FAD-binding and (Fe-S)-binding domain-containing protein [Flavihumibacter stibioxidans]MBC6492102.1 FAD-linked oxidase [Flavihumibacter stibioxidans]
MNLEARLLEILPEERIRTRLIDLLSYAADAGFYYLVPRAVVQPVSESEVIRLFLLSAELQVPLVFRTGGTSLSGQSITDGILVDLSQHWNRIKVSDDGRLVTVAPGITGAMVNAHLRRHQVKIGPDPSSIGAAMMGGILSNNASGMCCGVTRNSYHTTRSIRFILPDGKTFSTANPDDYTRFETECSEIFNTLRDIHAQVAADTALAERIRYKYTTKNTVGYSLNSFIDYQHPLDILAHLLIGAEGTLAFIAEATLETIPDHPFKSTALLFFNDIYGACQVIRPLIGAGAEMVELMDRASLYAVQDLKGIDPVVKQLPETAAALLVEFQEATEAELTDRVNSFMAGAAAWNFYNAPEFKTDATERELLWKMRKGLFPAVGAVRASGTTVVLEDIAFPLPVLGNAIFDLQSLFKKYEYNNAIIFGHAKDGNLHFVVTQSFNEAHEVDRYDRFLRDVVDLVVNKYDGTLKAEHGTGRNMAPFVETEWKGDAYLIMKKIKSVVDPKNLLNPGVIINDDKQVHVKNLKQLPQVESEVDRCIECGFCEPVCPSRNLTLTPRRRIMVRRELKKLQAAGRMAEHDELLQQYQYDGLETCAVDGLCGGACPVDINTGDLVKRLRRENHSENANKIALKVAKHFALVERMARMGLKSGTILNKLAGRKSMEKLTGGMRKIIPAMPLWNEQMPASPSLSALRKTPLKPAGPAAGQIVYFPACISRMMGSGINGKPDIMTTFLQVAEKAGIGVNILNNIIGACCGQIYSSKGYQPAYRFTANAIVENLWASSEQGRYVIVIDVSSCAYTLHHLRPVLTPANQQKYDQLTVLDSVDFLHDYVLPVVNAARKKGKVVLHPVCSIQKMGIQHKLTAIASHFANEVIVPKNAGCCGMAGDRGFLFPELTASATAPEAAEVVAAEYDGYYSSTKTCEMALSQAVKKDYESILYLVNECL